MARVQILNPSDQPTGKWRLIKELSACLRSEDYHTLRMAVAFAKTGPLLRLNAQIDGWLAKGKTIFSIFGVNHRNTSRQALEFALAKFTKAHVLFHSDDFTYHPKMYLFVGERKCKFFIGSHNLTVGGTETNWESGTELSLNLPEDEEMFAEAMSAWESLSAFSLQLNRGVIQKYKIFGKLSDEAEPRKRQFQTRVVDCGIVPGAARLPRLELRVKPPSPIPKDLFVRKSPKRIAVPGEGVPEKETPSPISAEALVIQIVPHHNGEVFLSKIALDQNPGFFGFPFTGQTRPKKASNPSYPQREPDPIVDLKVYGDGAAPIVYLPRLALNTVYYNTKSEIRITVPPKVVQNTPALSILVMRRAPDDSDFDYEMEVYPPTNPQFLDYLAVCNQTMPSGGRADPRRMGWL